MRGMDWLVEKATELGVAAIQPLHTERSVLRLAGERAAKKQQHWQQVAVAACEQCGGNRVPVIAPVADIEAMLDFEEGELPERFLEERRCALATIAADMEALMATWNEGRLLRGGLFLIVVAGIIIANMRDRRLS